MTEEFEPRIVAFLCNWCSYAGADNAGVARIPSPPNILPVRVMCSGRVSPEMVMRAFRAGADGVVQPIAIHVEFAQPEAGDINQPAPSVGVSHVHLWHAGRTEEGAVADL